ncbi:PHP domain-containing protein [Clostridium polynesiense]|uniref:PHP domain-containing protein n=1 Tax=Clostridium polynesiense TaxID=1325933 RepID=UPI00058FACC3|nr:PHP domain-containing protein [Clostridium polynesiense]
MKIDLHVHTNFSDGQPTYMEVIDKAKELGMDCIAITDHFDNYDTSPNIRRISDGELLEFFKKIKSYAEFKEQKVLCGIETCTDFNGNLRISDEVYNASEILITSVHYVEYSGELVKGEYFNDGYWEAFKEKIINMASGKGDVQGHPEGYLPINPLIKPGTTTYEERKAISSKIASRYFQDDFLKELADSLIKSGKAYELHGATSTPRESIIKFMASKNVTFSIGSDAHILDWIGKNQRAEEMCNKYNCKLVKV